MAELAVLNIAKSLLEQLSSPAKDEFLLWFNSKNELQKLKNTISTIKGVIHDAEQKKATNTDIGGWLSRLQDEMYKADDLFDTISTRALRQKVISGNKFKKEMMVFFSKSNQAAFAIKIAHKVKELRERLDDIAKDISQFGLIRSTLEYDQMSQRTAMKRKAQHSFIMEDEVIGREKDKEELLRQLMADAGLKERVSVIAVVGIGGQGKTAIAQLLFNAKEVEEFFELRLWSCVNYFSDLKEALEEITSTKSHSLEELQNKLRAKINGKKFLLVIDDVWDDVREQWLGLKRLLDAGESGSKVLMTTRSQEVAQNLATVRPHYALGELSDEDAWILFKKMAFDSDKGEDDQTKEELGRQIVKKCPKVPLAIRTIGSFLYGKERKQWSSFVDNELMKAMPGRENIVMQVLKISYDDLPLSLKHCFAYCSLFPKDLKFDQSTLIHLWMAQGLLETSYENSCLEEVGESYFLYLVQRGFFQNVEVNDDGDIICYKMHDLFHDLAVEIASNECQTMLKITDDLGRKFPRHLFVMEIKESLLQCKGLRSLVSPYTGFVERTLIDGVLMNLTSLRTLCLLHLDIEEIPSSIGELVHLRYFDLTGSEKLIKFPDSHCKLQNLLILILEGCENLIKLPDDLQKLTSLRCLKIKGCYKLKFVPSELERLTSLVTLDRLIVDKDHGGLRCLKHLNNLTGHICIELPIRWKNCVVDAEQSMLTYKTKLSGLSIRWNSMGWENIAEADVVLDRLQPSTNINHLKLVRFPGAKFPYWLSSLHNLVELSLVKCSSCHELPRLRHLFQLKRLRILDIPFIEYVENDTCYESGPFFPSLEYLEISRMSGLRGWRRPEGEVCGTHSDLWFPRLSHLQIDYCERLTSMPLCPVAEHLSLRLVSANLVTQLLRLPKAIELEANNSSAAPTSHILRTHTCSKLNDLSLDQIIKDLDFMPEDLKNMASVRHLSIKSCYSFKRSSLFHLLQHLPSLEILEYSGFRRVESADGMPWRSLPRLKVLRFEFGSDQVGGRLLNGLHHLTKLERLDIQGYVQDDEDMQWTAPPNLKHLLIAEVGQMGCLNKIIHQLKNLQTLEICCCFTDEHGLNELLWEDLKGLRKLIFHSNVLMRSLPDKCCHLLALEDLQLSSCPNIASLPDWVSRLTSLDIQHCSKLKENCRKPVGSCWPLVRDIPYYSIRD